MRNDEDAFDLGDYPDTPASVTFASDIWRIIDQGKAGTLTCAEVTAAVLDYVEKLDPSLRVELRREHAAFAAWDDGLSRADDYARLKADLQRNSAVTHWLLDRMRDTPPPRE